jgi:hypothetical protein
MKSVRRIPIPATESYITVRMCREWSLLLSSILTLRCKLQESEMIDPGKSRKELTAEITELARLQNRSVKDATFFGWHADETAAYDERSKRLTVLRKKLSTVAAIQANQPSA